MANCRSCGAAIVFVESKAGKHIPCDPEVVTADECDVGDKLVTEYGEVIRVTGNRDDDFGLYGRISHFATCPNASEHRRR